MSVNIAVEKGHYDALNIDKDDVVLDIGACVGGFAKRYHELAKRIICFEPVPVNYHKASENLIKVTNVILFNKAIVGNEDKDRLINIDVNNRGAHSMYVDKNSNLIVGCENINEMIEAYKPTKLKLDCEGAEYEIIKAIKDWSGIKGLIMEWHEFIHKQERYEEIISLLKDQGFKVTGPEQPVNQTMVVALR